MELFLLCNRLFLLCSMKQDIICLLIIWQKN
uniref:Uncharacterized protein n=1 Tax=Siphoviridae sp. ctWhx86 TaxID=2826362 RepID=A0A8S5QQ18_9CAUD|nr:MAG TPA: hypothetical protein [Siphoviridae sp. ctWhx86]